MTRVEAEYVCGVVLPACSSALIDYWQGTGRGGRNGQEASIFILFHFGHMIRGHDGLAIDAEEYLLNFQKLAEEMDGCCCSPTQCAPPVFSNISCDIIHC